MSAEKILENLTKARDRAVKPSPARERLAALFDEGSFVELDAFAKADGSAGAVTGHGTVEGTPVFAFAQDKTAASGAVGLAQAAKVKKVYELAARTGAPVVGIYDSHGANLAEGLGALAAYGDMLHWSNRISGVVPQIAVVAGPCAGSAALVAASADLLVVSEEAEFFLTAPSIEAAQGKGAPGAGSAESAVRAGVAHLTAKDAADAVAKARRLLTLLPQNNLSSLPVFDFAAVEGAGERLRAACADVDGADAADLASWLCDEGSVVELLRGYGDGCAYTALAAVGGFTCGIAVTRGAALCREGCRKLAGLVQLCDAYQIPVVTLVNAPGFQADAKAEAAGLAKQAAALAHVYAEATTPKVSIITGKAYGAGYIALAGRSANADLVYAWPSAVVSALEPKTAAAILYADDVTADKPMDAVIAAYIAEEASPYAAAEAGAVDEVIDPADTRARLLSALDVLAGKRVERLPKKHSNLPL